MNLQKSLASAAALLACSTPASHAQATPAFPITSTFDGGLDGWVATGSDFVYLTQGGNPDGYLRHNDSTQDENRAEAPAKFLGNWESIKDVGVLIFNHRVFTKGASNSTVTSPYNVIISGPGGSAEWNGANPSTINSWVNVRVPIAQSNWTIRSGSWAGLIANVTLVSIRIEYYGQVPGETNRDQSGLDNIYLGRGTPASDLPTASIQFKPVVTFLSEQSVVYVIESSEDMNTFTTLATITGTGNIINYTDVRTLPNRQFYRLKVQ